MGRIHDFWDRFYGGIASDFRRVRSNGRRRSERQLPEPSDNGPMSEPDSPLDSVRSALLARIPGSVPVRQSEPDGDVGDPGDPKLVGPGDVYRAQGLYYRVLGMDPRDRTGNGRRSLQQWAVASELAARNRKSLVVDTESIYREDRAQLRRRGLRYRAWDSLPEIVQFILYFPGRVVGVVEDASYIYPEIAEEEELTTGIGVAWGIRWRTNDREGTIDYLGSVLPQHANEPREHHRNRLVAFRESVRPGSSRRLVNSMIAEGIRSGSLRSPARSNISWAPPGRTPGPSPPASGARELGGPASPAERGTRRTARSKGSRGRASLGPATGE